MTIYNLYIFDRTGALLYYHEWNRKKQAGISRSEEAKLMYGMIYSLKSFVSKVSPVDIKDGYLNYSTDKYKLHLYETPTQIKFILNTDLAMTGGMELLHQIYTQIYLNYAVLNPLWNPGEPITSELFAPKLEMLVKTVTPRVA